jgi:predicted phosphatase
MPSHFRGFKTKNFLKHITVEMEYISNERGQYVSPHKITVLDDEELDFSNVVAVDNNGLLDVEEFKAVAVYGTIGSIRKSRISPWDQDKYPEL